MVVKIFRNGNTWTQLTETDTRPVMNMCFLSFLPLHHVSLNKLLLTLVALIIYLSISLSTHPYIHFSIYLVYLFIYLSVCLPIYPSFYLSSLTISSTYLSSRRWKGWEVRQKYKERMKRREKRRVKINILFSIGTKRHFTTTCYLYCKSTIWNLLSSCLPTSSVLMWTIGCYSVNRQTSYDWPEGLCPVDFHQKPGTVDTKGQGSFVQFLSSSWLCRPHSPKDTLWHRELNKGNINR